MPNKENYPRLPVVEVVAIEKVIHTKTPAFFPTTSAVREPDLETKQPLPSSQPYREVATVTSSRTVTIGRDFEQHVPITVTDRQREGGFYILGKPRTGKSTLLVSMVLQDIENSHGVLFIDPHYEAISNLLERIPRDRLEDVVYLDPTEKTSSFGINLLHCRDTKEPLELEATAGRVRDIFAKVWGMNGVSSASAQ